MSLISLPNELLLRHILSCDAISIMDLKCVMISCHRLYKIIRKSNELWRQKFLSRWPHLYVALQKDDKHHRLWLEWVSLQLKVSKLVRKTVEKLSAIYYPNGNVPMSVLGELIEKDESEYPIIILFVEDALRDLIFYQEKHEALTLSYYASGVLDNVKRCIQFKNWKEFIAKQPSLHSLLDGALLISVWFQTCNDVLVFISLCEIDCALERIFHKVKQNLLMDNAPSSVQENFIDPIKNGKKILDMISKVLFNDMDFYETFCEFTADDDLLSIYKVLETGKGCATILCIIYYEIALKMGIKCDPVYYSDKLLLRWQEYPDFYYIDVCDSGSLKHSVFYPSVINHEPASVNNILRQMMHQYNESVRGIIRTDDDVLYNSDDLKYALAESVRLECAISPHDIPCIIEYAELSIHNGSFIDEAVQLLRSIGRQDDDLLIVRCKNELSRYQHEIDAARIACVRVSSIRFAVGLVMNYKYEDPDDEGVMRCGACVITSWDVIFKESKEWTTGAGVCNFDQPFYRILLDEDAPGYLDARFEGLFNVAEETLELHPTGVAIKHRELGNHFERFDGRKYVLNAEAKAHYPEDEAAALAIIAGR